MRIIRMRVTNFSSFKDTHWINLSSGINLIVGQNNAGKSALLRVFNQSLEDKRHRSQTEFRQERLGLPWIYFDLEVSGNEVNDSMLQQLNPFSWPFELQSKEIDISQFLSEPSHIMHLCRCPGDGYYLNRQLEKGPQTFRQLVVENARLRVVNNVISGEENLQVIRDVWFAKVFSFNAQRYSVGTNAFKREKRLKSDASNLAGILSKLQGEQGSLFERLVGHLSEIFSTVKNLSVAPTTEGFEIRVWPTKERRQIELSFSLDDSGTGVGQVIAILTIAMTFEGAVIVIDEISSFLHPAAAKALLRILQTYYAQHQYIIATHSPEVLSAGNPTTVHVVRRQGYDSLVERVDLNKLDNLRDVANHLGVSMTDVFAAERIIWVEGPTEEVCLPLIYKETEGELPGGLTITPVIATGDFLAKMKRRDLVFQVYQRLSQAAMPLVKSVTFSFDRETLTEKEMSNLNRDSGGRLLFLPRRHFECYLLNPAAIAALITATVPDLADSVSPENVLNYLQSVGGQPKFKATRQWNGDIFDEKWLTEIDAAALLKETCNELTATRLEYCKTRHSIVLLQHILAHNSESLCGLIAHVKKLFELAQHDADWA
jgi:predicted ATPase